MRPSKPRGLTKSDSCQCWCKRLVETEQKLLQSQRLASTTQKALEKAQRGLADIKQTGGAKESLQLAQQEAAAAKADLKQAQLQAAQEKNTLERRIQELEEVTRQAEKKNQGLEEQLKGVEKASAQKKQDQCKPPEGAIAVSGGFKTYPHITIPKGTAVLVFVNSADADDFGQRIKSRFNPSVLRVEKCDSIFVGCGYTPIIQAHGRGSAHGMVAVNEEDYENPIHIVRLEQGLPPTLISRLLVE